MNENKLSDEQILELLTRAAEGMKMMMTLIEVLGNRVSRLEEAMKPISVEDILDGKTRPQVGLNTDDAEKLMGVIEKIHEIMGPDFGKE